MKRDLSHGTTVWAEVGDFPEVEDGCASDSRGAATAGAMQHAIPHGRKRTSLLRN